MGSPVAFQHKGKPPHLLGLMAASASSGEAELIHQCGKLG